MFWFRKAGFVALESFALQHKTAAWGTEEFNAWLRAYTSSLQLLCVSSLAVQYSYYSHLDRYCSFYRRRYSFYFDDDEDCDNRY